MGDDASILSVRRGREALKRERASQVDLRRQEQARARRRGDFPEVRRIQGMIDEINDEASFVNVNFAADEGSYGSYGDDLSCVTFDTLATVEASRRGGTDACRRGGAAGSTTAAAVVAPEKTIGLRTRPRGGLWTQYGQTRGSTRERRRAAGGDLRASAARTGSGGWTPVLRSNVRCVSPCYLAIARAGRGGCVQRPPRPGRRRRPEPLLPGHCASVACGETRPLLRWWKATGKKPRTSQMSWRCRTLTDYFGGPTEEDFEESQPDRAADGARSVSCKRQPRAALPERRGGSSPRPEAQPRATTAPTATAAL